MALRASGSLPQTRSHVPLCCLESGECRSREGRQGGEGRGKARSFPAQRPARLSLSATPVFLTSAARRFPHLTMPTMPTRVRSARPRAEPAPRLKRRRAGAAAGRRSGDSGAGRDQRTAVHNRKQSPRREKAQDAKGRTRKKVFFNRSQFLHEYEKRDFGLVCGSIRE